MDREAVARELVALAKDITGARERTVIDKARLSCLNGSMIHMWLVEAQFNPILEIKADSAYLDIRDIDNLIAALNSFKKKMKK